MAYFLYIRVCVYIYVYTDLTGISHSTVVLCLHTLYVMCMGIAMVWVITSTLLLSFCDRITCSRHIHVYIQCRCSNRRLIAVFYIERNVKLSEDIRN